MSIIGRDALGLSAYWHSDCRLEQELPNENLIRTRFLTNALFGAAAFASMLFCGWLGYSCLTLNRQVSDLEANIADHSGEIREIQRMQRDYVAEAGRIDQAYAVIRPNLFVSEFLGQVGSTLPEQMIVDSIIYNETGIVVRGTLRESSEKATQLLGNYVELLQQTDKKARRFREILLTSLERGKGEERMSFELTFRLQPLPPL